MCNQVVGLALCLCQLGYCRWWILVLCKVLVFTECSEIVFLFSLIYHVWYKSSLTGRRIYICLGFTYALVMCIQLFILSLSLLTDLLIEPGYHMLSRCPLFPSLVHDHQGLQIGCHCRASPIHQGSGWTGFHCEMLLCYILGEVCTYAVLSFLYATSAFLHLLDLVTMLYVMRLQWSREKSILGKIHYEVVTTSVGDNV